MLALALGLVFLADCCWGFLCLPWLDFVDPALCCARGTTSLVREPGVVRVTAVNRGLHARCLVSVARKVPARGNHTKSRSIFVFEAYRPYLVHVARQGRWLALGSPA